ncbi:MAG: inositol monophosphatase [Sulfurospirillum sp.]|nr:inositol monophosphatase [Sulfurospirillum sp.]
MIQKFIKAVICANEEISELLSHGLRNDFYQPIAQGFGGDISSKIDVLAENIFIKHLHLFGTIYSEEKGIIPAKSAYTIIIDPIDGSDNFHSKIPYFGTSVALKRNNKTLVAVIVNLANNDIFIKDTKRFVRGKLHAKLLMNVCKNPYAKSGIFERSYCSKIIAPKLLEEEIKYRSPGAFALSLAYAHDVSFVLYEGSMRIFDIAAGLYMCADLYVKSVDQILLVSKDKETFDKMSGFIFKP